MITTPEELRSTEQKLEDANNRLLIADQNYTRVRNLHISEEQEIGLLQGVRTDLEKHVIDLKKDIDTYTTKVNGLKDTDEGLTAKIAQSKTELEAVQTSMKKEIENHAKRDAELTEREKAVSSREVAVTKREEVVLDQETSVIEKHNKIKQFISNI